MSSHDWAILDDWDGDEHGTWACSRCGSNIWSNGMPAPDAIVIVSFEETSSGYKRGTCDDAIVARVMDQ
jgi:hypothetical protein